MKLRSNTSYGEHKQKVLRRIFVKNQKTKSTEPEERKRGESAKNSNKSGERRTKEKASTTVAKRR